MKLINIEERELEILLRKKSKIERDIIELNIALIQIYGKINKLVFK